MNKERKALQDKLRRKYGWRSCAKLSSDFHGFLYKSVPGAWAFKRPDLGRATIDMDFEAGGVLGDVYITLHETFCESKDNNFDRSIGITLSFEELESLYLIAKDVHDERGKLNNGKCEKMR